MSKRIMITISKELEDYLETERLETGASVAEIVRRAVSDRYRIANRDMKRGGWKPRKQHAVLAVKDE